MPTLTFDHRFEVEAPVETVGAFHFSPNAFISLKPPLSPIRLISAEPLAEGSRLLFRMGLGPVGLDWLARHEGVDPRSGFTDVSEQGPMRAWRHTHRWRALGPNRTEVHDHIEFEHPDGALGWFTRLAFGKPALQLLFWSRARATRAALRG